MLRKMVLEIKHDFLSILYFYDSNLIIHQYYLDGAKLMNEKHY